MVDRKLDNMEHGNVHMVLHCAKENALLHRRGQRREVCATHASQDDKKRTYENLGRGDVDNRSLCERNREQYDVMSSPTHPKP